MTLWELTFPEDKNNYVNTTSVSSIIITFEGSSRPLDASLDCPRGQREKAAHGDQKRTSRGLSVTCRRGCAPLFVDMYRCANEYSYIYWW